MNSIKNNHYECILGTVQIGLPYGNRAHFELCDKQKANEILRTAWEFGIRSFDTADGYGESANRLSKWLCSNGLLEKANIITKLVYPESLSSYSLKKATDPFKGARKITVLTHGFLPKDKWEQFKDNCNELGFESGQSVYSFDEVIACSNLGIRKVQAPGNVLDLKQIQAAADYSIDLDVRSIFLQGTLLIEPSEAEKRVPGLFEIVELIQYVSDSFGVSRISLLINTVIAFCVPKMRLVIGADSPEQIPQWFAAFKNDLAMGKCLIKKIHDKFGDKISREIIDPRFWNK